MSDTSKIFVFLSYAICFFATFMTVGYSNSAYKVPDLSLYLYFYAIPSIFSAIAHIKHFANKISDAYYFIGSLLVLFVFHSLAVNVMFRAETGYMGAETIPWLVMCVLINVYSLACFLASLDRPCA